MFSAKPPRPVEASAMTEANTVKAPLTLTLGSNKLVFDNGWKVINSELLVAANQINALLDEKLALNNTISSLRNEIVETNKMKTVTMDMVSGSAVQQYVV